MMYQYILRRDDMNITVHDPETEKAKKHLAACVARLHAELIENSLRRLECRTEQKIALLDEIIFEIRRGAI